MYPDLEINGGQMLFSNKALIPLLITLLAASVSAAWEYPGDVSIIGSEEIVFDHSTDSCEAEMIPDTPTRVFRDAAGNIQLLIGHNVTYRMTGPDFDNLSVDCAAGPVFTSHRDADPANFNDNEWIGSLYTKDGATIYAMIHNEYHGTEHDGGCTSTDPFECWYNAITFGVSTDSGRTYTHATAPDHLLASIPYTWTGNGPYGFFEPSNIIHNPQDDLYYMFITANEGHQLQETGVGLVRTADISDPTSWRGWDGEDFTVRLINPYTETGFDPADHVLARIDGNLRTYGNHEKMHYSVAYSTYFEKFILVDAASKGGVWGFYYSLSEDLLHWTPRKLIMEANVNINPDGATTGLRESYPTLIDHGDTTRNFSQVGQTPYLYWTRYDQDAGDIYERDLVRVQVSFEKLLVDGFTVTHRGDSEDENPGDGMAITSYDVTNLRAALQESYYRPEWYVDSMLTINFNIEVSSHTFYASTPFMPIRFPTTLDGTTDPQHAANTNNFGETINAVYAGLLSGDYPDFIVEPSAAGSAIKGLEIEGTITILGDNVTVSGNSVGRISIDSSSYNTIGGTENSERNRLGSVRLFGPGANYNQVEGNYIGTDADGSVSAGSEFSAINLGYGAYGNSIINNLLSGSGFAGIEIANTGSDSNVVRSNIIGLDRTATTALPNPASGIKVQNVSETIIAENTISGNDGEAGIFASDIQNTVIQDNLIGTNADGDALGNTGFGLWLTGNSNDIEISGNTIAFNGSHGIDLTQHQGVGASILGNSIYTNTGSGIEAPYEWQYQPPVFSLAFSTLDSLRLEGTFNGAADANFRLEFFTNSECDPDGSGEGQTYIGYADVTTGSAGSVTFSHSIGGDYPSGTIITATATDALGNTSAFSPCITAFGDSDAPILAVSTDTLTYTFYPEDTPVETQNIELANEGLFDLEWSSSTSAAWIFLEPASGSIGSGDTVLSGITVYAVDVPDGIYHETVTINTNDPLSPEYAIRITVNNGEGGLPLITAAPDTVRLTVSSGPDVTTGFMIHNNGAGDDPLNWSAGMPLGSPAWLLEPSPTSGSIAAGDSSEITFGIRPSNLSSGLNTSFIWVSSNAANINVLEVQIEVTLGTSTNNPPVANELVVDGDEDSLIDFVLSGNDPDGNPLSYQLVSNPVHGWLDGTLPYLVFHPDSNFFGADSFQFKVNDGALDSDPAWVWINVAAVNDAPAAFDLLSPENGFTINFNTDTQDSIVLSWEASSDVDSDILYHFENAGLEEIVMTPQSGTSFSIATTDLKKHMDSTYTTVYWNIYASDGEFEVRAANGPFTINLIDLVPTGIDPALVPDDFVLHENFPNPFNPGTTIRFGLPEAGRIRLEVLDLTGRRVAVLAEGEYSAGTHHIFWNATNDLGNPVSAGIYFYRLVTRERTLVRKMMLLK